MSCYWHLSCVTCATRTDDSLNRGDRVLRALLRALPHLVIAQQVDSAAGGWLEFSLTGGHEEIVGFALEHAGHALQIVSEYGDILEHDPSPGDYERARGILPWQPGEALSEERIRRLRDSGAGDDLLAEQPAHYPLADEEESS